MEKGLTKSKNVDTPKVGTKLSILGQKGEIIEVGNLKKDVFAKIKIKADDDSTLELTILDYYMNVNDGKIKIVREDVELSYLGLPLDEANPWHDKGGRFPKGGKKNAIMYSLWGTKKYLTKRTAKKSGERVFAKKQTKYKSQVRDQKGRFTGQRKTVNDLVASFDDNRKDVLYEEMKELNKELNEVIEILSEGQAADVFKKFLGDMGKFMVKMNDVTEKELETFGDNEEPGLMQKIFSIYAKIKDKNLYKVRDSREYKDIVKIIKNA